MKVFGSEQVEALCLRGEFLANLPRGGGNDALLLVEILPRVLLPLLALDEALPWVPLRVLLLLSAHSGAVRNRCQPLQLFFFFGSGLQINLALAQCVEVHPTEGARAEFCAA